MELIFGILLCIGIVLYFFFTYYYVTFSIVFILMAVVCVGYILRKNESIYKYVTLGSVLAISIVSAYLLGCIFLHSEDEEWQYSIIDNSIYKKKISIDNKETIERLSCYIELLKNLPKVRSKAISEVHQNHLYREFYVGMSYNEYEEYVGYILSNGSWYGRHNWDDQPAAGMPPYEIIDDASFYPAGMFVGNKLAGIELYTSSEVSALLVKKIESKYGTPHMTMVTPLLNIWKWEFEGKHFLIAENTLNNYILSLYIYEPTSLSKEFDLYAKRRKNEQERLQKKQEQDEIEKKRQQVELRQQEIEDSLLQIRLMEESKIVKEKTQNDF